MLVFSCKMKNSARRIALAAVLILTADVSLPGPAAAEFAEPAEIVFAVRQPGVGGHWYENFGYYAFDENDKVYGARGRLCRLNLRHGRAHRACSTIPTGAVRDPQVHYDGGKILFSYRQGGIGLLSPLRDRRRRQRAAAAHRRGRTTTSSRPTCPTAGSCSAPAAAIAGSTAGTRRWRCSTAATRDGTNIRADLGQHRARQHAVAACPTAA